MEWILIIVGLAAVLAIVWYVLNGRVEGETDAHGVTAAHGVTHATTAADSAVQDAAAPVTDAAVAESGETRRHAGAHVAASPAVDAPAAEVVRDRDAYDDVVVHEADDAPDLIDDDPREAERMASVPEADHAARVEEAATKLAGAQDAPAVDHAARIDEAAARLQGATASDENLAGRRYEEAPSSDALAEPADPTHSEPAEAPAQRVVEVEPTPQRVVEPEPVVESVVVPQPAPQRVAEPSPVVEPEPQRIVEPGPARRLVEPTDADIEQVWDGPFGPGSAEAGPNGEGPRGWTIKGARQTKVYLTPDIPVFNSAKANVWFVDEQRAIDAGFHRWDAPQG